MPRAVRVGGYEFDDAIMSHIRRVHNIAIGQPTAEELKDLFSTELSKGKAQGASLRKEQIDLDDSYAYSDSVSDLPMLRVVGHPVAVNPDAALARLAREEGWEVLRFERLGRRLKAAVGLSAAALTGGVGSAALIRGRRRKVLGVSRPGR